MTGPEQWRAVDDYFVDLLIAGGEAPFDLVFIDADKNNYPHYLDRVLQLSRPGTVIVGDKVVRRGAVADAGSTDPMVNGVQTFLAAAGNHQQLTTTALQTVGRKGWDGFSISLVEGSP